MPRIPLACDWEVLGLLATHRSVCHQLCDTDVRPSSTPVPHLSLAFMHLDPGVDPLLDLHRLFHRRQAGIKDLLVPLLRPIKSHEPPLPRLPTDVWKGTAGEECVAIWHPPAHHCPSRSQIERTHTIDGQHCRSGVSLCRNLHCVRCSHTPPWLPKRAGMASWRSSWRRAVFKQRRNSFPTRMVWLELPSEIRQESGQHGRTLCVHSAKSWSAPPFNTKGCPIPFEAAWHRHVLGVSPRVIVSMHSSLKLSECWLTQSATVFLVRQHESPAFESVGVFPSFIQQSPKRSRFRCTSTFCTSILHNSLSQVVFLITMEWNEGTQSTHGDAPCALVKSPNTSAAGGASPPAPGCPRRSNNEEAKARAAAQTKREPHRCIQD